MEPIVSICVRPLRGEKSAKGVERQWVALALVVPKSKEAEI